MSSNLDSKLRYELPKKMKWKVGNVEIPNRFVLAPMAGVTDLAFRRLCKEQGAGLLCMEMISAKAISYKNKNTRALMEIDPVEHPISMQLFGSEPELMTEVAKEIEEQSLMTMSQVIEEELPLAEVAVLSGPSHAEEVSRGLPTTCVAAAHRKKTAEFMQSVFMSPVFRIYTSPDMLGVEIGAALKNVIALAAGVADGLGCGDNTKAALITRGIAEMSRLGVAMGGKQQTFYGLSGIGDLIVTCASMHSRNRRAGILIGKGYTMDEAMKEVQMVVEGAYSAKAGLLLAQKYGCDMPIVSQVNQVLFDGKSPKEALADLMMRDPRIESSDLPWEG